MRLALTAVVLTAAYLDVLAVNQPFAAEVAGFYIAAVTILVVAQRLADRKDRRARPS